VLSLQNSESGALYEVAGVKSLGDAAWSPNGSFVAFVVKDTSAAVAHEIVVVDHRNASVQTRTEAPKGHPIISGLQWSPNGRKVLASGGTARASQAPTYEYWVMENFLPGEKEGEK
jgi:Tol biopolymer transport system component